MYEMRRRALSDWTTGVNTAFEKGVEKERFDIAKNALSAGLSVDIITKITGLDEATISTL